MRPRLPLTEIIDGDIQLLPCSHVVSQADILVSRLHVDLRRHASAICAPICRAHTGC
ncbi:putative leader peptide [Streptomyces coryli]|uniref:putative leader peptide n=1 Tax=Streptomyces coryli TaxID=1128680 RepID=UPI003B833F6F